MAALFAMLAWAASGSTSELRLMQLPSRPHPNLGPSDVVRTLCLALQHNNVPRERAGLSRLYDFCTFEARSALTARQGARTRERFEQYAHSPAFAELVNSAHHHVAPATIIPGTQTRGALATVIVSVEGFAADGSRGGLPGEAADVAPKRFRWLLQQERRPPHEGCWFVNEVVALEQWFLFNGDSGSTTTD
ncbi:hypothetical protein KFE25_007585 [Diacronema lutheri]|uniref:SnoaL-like domain-containing protein n=2 Tax=Diacronema lutheri TaxID=2081491 RepID=A0A8J5XVA8_DIALT|nr:hypothetical protein KFE25_007585 [Diacronema lutheri]